MEHRRTAELSALPNPSQEFLRAVGEQLRATREEAGEDLYAVAEALRIKPHYLCALETGDYSVFPARPYAFGFLRSYAEYLGYDGAEVLRRVKEVVDAPAPEPKLAARKPFAERHRPTAVRAIALTLLLAVGFGGWYTLRQLDRNTLDRLADLPRQIATWAQRITDAGGAGREAIVQASSSGTPPAADTPMAASTPERLIAIEGAPPVLPRAVLHTTIRKHARPRLEEAEADAVSAVAAELRDGPAGAAPASGTGEDDAARTARRLLAGLASADSSPQRLHAQREKMRGGITLVARSDTWVQVRSRDHSYVETRTLQAGDRLELPARDDLALWAADGGGLEIWLGRKRVGLAGPPGVAVRNVSLAGKGLPTRLN